MDELRLAIRRLTKHPAPTLASIATLACAIGAAVVTWSALSALLLTPLPIEDAHTMFVVGSRATAGTDAGRVQTGFVYPVYERVRDGGVFMRVAPYWSPRLLLVTGPSSTANASVAFAGHQFFELLGLPFSSGRGFFQSEDQRGVAPAAVLADHYWRGAFASDPSVVGRTITIAGTQAIVIGILGPPFQGIELAERVDIYLPFHTIGNVGRSTTNYFADRGTGYSPTSGTTIIGRLEAPASEGEAISRLRAVMGGGVVSKTAEPVLVTLNAHAIPERARAMVLQFSKLLATTVALLLLIGCCAAGTLLLVRTEARRQELGVCLALGASRARLASGIVAEAAVLSLTGGVLAVPVSSWLGGIVRTFELPGGIAIQRLDLPGGAGVLTTAIVGAILSILLVGGIASSFALRADSGDARIVRPGATPRNRRGLRTVLVAAQVAVALTLAAGAGVFARSVAAALSLNGGEDMTRVVSTDINLAAHGYTSETARHFFEALRARLSLNPAVDAIAISSDLGGMSSRGAISIDGVPRTFSSTMWEVGIDTEYLRAMSMRLVSGREFLDSDFRGGPPVALVSESFARAIDGGNSVLGRRLPVETGRSDTPQDGRVIVGVVSDVVTNLAVLDPLTTYVPLAADAPRVRRQIVMRAAGDPAAAKRELIATIRQIDRSVVPGPLSSLDERLARQLAPQQFALRVLGVLGVIAALLTLIGSYVVADALATSRMREMGIRAALGATRRQLGSIVLTEIVRLVGVGLMAGLGLAWLAANTIRSFLFQVQPLDPLTLGSVAALILGLALAVSIRAVLRAACVDLSTVLKAE